MWWFHQDVYFSSFFYLCFVCHIRPMTSGPCFVLFFGQKQKFQNAPCPLPPPRWASSSQRLDSAAPIHPAGVRQPAHLAIAHLRCRHLHLHGQQLQRDRRGLGRTAGVGWVSLSEWGRGSNTPVSLQKKKKKLKKRKSYTLNIPPQAFFFFLNAIRANRAALQVIAGFYCWSETIRKQNAIRQRVIVTQMTFSYLLVFFLFAKCSLRFKPNYCFFHTPIHCVLCLRRHHRQLALESPCLLRTRASLRGLRPSWLAVWPTTPASQCGKSTSFKFLSTDVSGFYLN